MLTALNVVGSITRFGLPHPTMVWVTWNRMLGTSFLVGFIEEVPNRGLMLQKFAERLGFGRATLETSLLFVAVRLAGWLALHILRADTAATILVFGVVTSVAFKWSDSLSAPIATQSANDFLSFAIFRR